MIIVYKFGVVYEVLIVPTSDVAFYQPQDNWRKQNIIGTMA